MQWIWWKVNLELSQRDSFSHLRRGGSNHSLITNWPFDGRLPILGKERGQKDKAKAFKKEKMAKFDTGFFQKKIRHAKILLCFFVFFQNVGFIPPNYKIIVSTSRPFQFFEPDSSFSSTFTFSFQGIFAVVTSFFFGVNGVIFCTSSFPTFLVSFLFKLFARMFIISGGGRVIRVVRGG